MNINTQNYPSAPPAPMSPIMQQPGPMMNNVVVVNSGNNAWDFENEWNHDLCSCCDNCGQCCFAMFCWYCFMCSLVNRARESCCIYLCVPTCITLAFLRVKTRSMFRLRGSICKDLCASHCCPFCTALQLSNELTSRGV